MRKVINFQLIFIFMLLMLISFCCVGYTAEETLTWDKTFGGSDRDVALYIIQTEDGGYAISGYTIFKNIGEADFYIIILDEKGNKLLNKTFFGSNWDCAYSIIQTKDEGYVIFGYTWSKGAGEADAWIIKLDEKGNLK